MTPEERIARRLIVEIENELDHLAALREEAAAAPRDDMTYGLRARGSILHDFYSGIERVFRRIADEVDGGVPQGEQWHRQLVTDMTLEIPGVRPGPDHCGSRRPGFRNTSLFDTCFGMSTDT